MKWLCLWIGILLPTFASASVSFSEVAWMGSAESANHEWIELHNNGEAVDVSGWIVTDGMNLAIELSGIIPANTYVVLERTTDDSALGTAFLIYTGALVNTGATLKLSKGDDSLVDQVSGGENWQNIGGDNVSKETAQYTSGGWVTAAPTPGTALVAATQPPTQTANKEEIKTSTKTIAKKVSSGEPVKLELPDVTLKLAIEAQTLGYVNQVIDFSVLSSGIGKSLIDSLQYQWNFGDGMTATAKETSHVFAYPGTYVVTVEGEFKRQRQVTRHEITILPVEISLTKNEAGDIQVNNDSPYEIDVSGYRLQGSKGFEFPSHSVILPNQTITIPRQKVVSGQEAMVALYDTENLSVAAQLPSRFNEPTSLSLAMVSPEKPVAPRKKISAISDNQILDLSPINETALMSEEVSQPVIEEEELSLSEVVSTSSNVAVVGTAGVSRNERWIYVALASTMLIGVLGVYATPRRNIKSSDLLR